MFGKGSLLVVFGFILAFSIYQNKMGQAVRASSDNFNQYYTSTMIHESAISGLNIGVNKVWDQEISSDSFNVVLNGCTTYVSIYPIGSDTLRVKAKSWGYAYEDEYYANNNDFMKIEDSILANFSYNMAISKYFWFTNNENGVYWITGDSVWGPIHTNSVLNTNGEPVFYGKVTAYRGIAPNPARRHGANRAHFYGGWEVGIHVDIPTDLSPLIDAANDGNDGAPVNEKCIYNQPTTFEFLSNGTAIRQVGTSPQDTVTITDIAPTGVIYSNKDIRVKGVFNGQVTMFSEDDIWIDDDLVYADNPLTNGDSDDLLGLVSRDNVIITDNGPNNSDINLQACIMAMNGSFTAQNYSGRPVSGKINFTGSIVQNIPISGHCGWFPGGNKKFSGMW
jgi:hypothetical protein